MDLSKLRVDVRFLADLIFVGIFSPASASASASANTTSSTPACAPASASASSSATSTSASASVASVASVSLDADEKPRMGEQRLEREAVNTLVQVLHWLVTNDKAETHAAVLLAFAKYSGDDWCAYISKKIRSHTSLFPSHLNSSHSLFFSLVASIDSLIAALYILFKYHTLICSNIPTPAHSY